MTWIADIFSLVDSLPEAAQWIGAGVLGILAAFGVNRFIWGPKKA